MPRTYSMTTKVTWARTMLELADEFRKWGVKEKDWDVRSLAREESGLSPERRRVTLAWTSADGHATTLVMEAQPRAVDNLRVLFLAVESLRMNESRGIVDVIKQAYAQIAAPMVQRDPYEVLGIRPDADDDIVKAAYRAASRRAHPESGGTNDLQTTINLAFESIEKERGRKL